MNEVRGVVIGESGIQRGLSSNSSSASPGGVTKVIGFLRLLMGERLGDFIGQFGLSDYGPPHDLLSL